MSETKKLSQIIEQFATETLLQENLTIDNLLKMLNLLKLIIQTLSMSLKTIKTLYWLIFKI